jgi:hypothetical protein
MKIDSLVRASWTIANPITGIVIDIEEFINEGGRQLQLIHSTAMECFAACGLCLIHESF